ncbi:hypothetical protein CYMTET_52613, partial [Cymbomonas tetramitiformis]
MYSNDKDDSDSSDVDEASLRIHRCGNDGRVLCQFCRKDAWADVHALYCHAKDSRSSTRKHKALAKYIAVNVFKCEDTKKSCGEAWRALNQPVTTVATTESERRLPPVLANTRDSPTLVWPPIVVVHNIPIERGSNGDLVPKAGLGNPDIQEALSGVRELHGSAKIIYGPQGCRKSERNRGIALQKFNGTLEGHDAARTLCEKIRDKGLGRTDWEQGSRHSSDELYVFMAEPEDMKKYFPPSSKSKY